MLCVPRRMRAAQMKPSTDRSSEWPGTSRPGPPGRVRSSATTCHAACSPLQPVGGRWPGPCGARSSSALCRLAVSHHRSCAQPPAWRQSGCASAITGPHSAGPGSSREQLHHGATRSVLQRRSAKASLGRSQCDAAFVEAGASAYGGVRRSPLARDPARASGGSTSALRGAAGRCMPRRRAAGRRPPGRRLVRRWQRGVAVWQQELRWLGQDTARCSRAASPTKKLRAPEPAAAADPKSLTASFPK